MSPRKEPGFAQFPNREPEGYPRKCEPSTLRNIESLTIPAAVALAVTLGVTLVFAATRATASVEDGTAFVRWMLVVFLAFLLLAALPIVLAF